MKDVKGGRNEPEIGREAAVKRLKIFYKITLADLDNDPATAVLNETDRGSVILLSTAIEDALLNRIKTGMVALTSDESDRMFGPDAPLGSFSAKIKIAYALGLVDRDIVRLCDLLREMRNACAHSGRAISFQDDELADVLRVAWRQLSDERLEMSKEIPELRKLVFVWIVAWLTIAIRTGSKDKAYQAVNGLLARMREYASKYGGR